jgi:hypothetical protein
MEYTYQVEWRDDLGRTHVEPYVGRRSAAISRAVRISAKWVVARVVASKRSKGETVPCGYKAYRDGRVTETVGEGFKFSPKRKSPGE